MPVVREKPLAWKAATADEKMMLENLQGNILKGHGRDYTANVFLRFDPAQRVEIRKWIVGLSSSITTAAFQLDETERRKAALAKKKKFKSKPVVFLLISKTGYAALDILGQQPTEQNGPWVQGMKANAPLLNDPPVNEWDEHFQGDVHAMLLVGDDQSKLVDTLRKKLLSGAPDGVEVLGIEKGRSFRNQHGDGIEHFGYVDGRSQPLLLREDVDHERQNTDGTSVWDPEFPLGQVLVTDPLAGDPNVFGSYFVFRKLEQNVKGFKSAEAKLAKALKLKGDKAERAGALMVGRFEDGTPVVLQHAEGMHNPVPNNFDYRDDLQGTKCPIHAHIRKTNPRGESVQPNGPAPNLASERSHIMARRGITYGARKTKKAGKGIEFTDAPKGGVGLLFMAYQSDVAKQFEFTQRTWANNLNFVKPNTGVDPVIGQGEKGGQKCPIAWGGDPANAEFKSFDFRNFVTLKGGEYFFAPSIGGLKKL